MISPPQMAAQDRGRQDGSALTGLLKNKKTSTTAYEPLPNAVFFGVFFICVTDFSLCLRGGGVTFVDGGEAFPHPVAAAAELDPHPAVSGDQDVGDFISAKPPC